MLFIKQCPTCGGKKLIHFAKDGALYNTCRDCNGTGYINDVATVDTILLLAYEQGIIAPIVDGNTHDCIYCNGTGKLVNVVCPFCNSELQE